VVKPFDIERLLDAVLDATGRSRVRGVATERDLGLPGFELS
jgi:hypothetical protein